MNTMVNIILCQEHILVKLSQNEMGIWPKWTNIVTMASVVISHYVIQLVVTQDKPELRGYTKRPSVTTSLTGLT